VAKVGRVLALEEEGCFRKSISLAAIRQSGYRYYRVIAENDERLCSVCRENDGNIYLIAQAKTGENIPPFHPNCRCTVEGVNLPNLGFGPLTSAEIAAVLGINNSRMSLSEKRAALWSLLRERFGAAREFLERLIDALLGGREDQPQPPEYGGGLNYNERMYNDFPRYRFHVELLRDIVINENAFAIDIERFRKIYNENFSIYNEIANLTNLPPQLIAAIHYRESGGNFNTHFHNGDPLGVPTVNHPAGILFHDFIESAVDALTNEYIRSNIYWYELSPDSSDMSAMLAFAETFNGHGYYQMNPRMPSPYLYSGTNAYISGKFVRDGVYDPNFLDRQPGIYILLRSLM
jgi:SPP1 gp7 family putative phage head morphogenesis protein